MALTISSVITMCFLNSLLILLLCLLLKRDIVLSKVGPKCMIILLLVILIRMFLPFEFSYAYSIRVEDWLSPFRRLLLHLLLTEPFELTVWQLLVFLWAAGIVLQVVYKLYTYRKVNRLMFLLPKEKWDSFCEKHQINPGDFNFGREITVVCSEQFQSPCLVGWKRCYLVLPAVEYEKEQLYYIILHEMMHAKNRDIGWKILMDLLCVIFWWNPVFWYLRKELFQLLEMRNDIRIIEKLSEKEKVSYMECLKDTAVQIVKKDIASSVAFSRSDLKALKRRLKLIAGYKSFGRGQQVFLSVLVGIVLFLMSMVVFEPYSIKQVVGEGFPITSDNTYLIKNGNKYDVYVNDEHIMTTDDLDSFRNIIIYNNMKEAQENE